MTALADAVIALLVASLTDLGGRVYVSLIPQAESLPAAVVDVTTEDDGGGIERGSVSVRLTDEDAAGEATGIGSLSIATLETLIGRNSRAPALEVEGYEVLDVGAGTVRTYATHEEGRRYVHAAISVEIVMERS